MKLQIHVSHVLIVRVSLTLDFHLFLQTEDGSRDEKLVSFDK